MFKIRSKRRMQLEPFQTRTLNISDWGLNSEQALDLVYVKEEERPVKIRTKNPKKKSPKKRKHPPGTGQPRQKIFKLKRVIREERNVFKEANSLLRKDRTRLIPIIAEWLVHWLHRRRLYYYLVVVLSNFGAVFQKRRQNKKSILKHCQTFLEHLKKTRLPIVCLLDKNAMAFNGCRSKKIRRKKRRHFLKRNIYVKYEKN